MYPSWHRLLFLALGSGSGQLGSLFQVGLQRVVVEKEEQVQRQGVQGDPPTGTNPNSGETQSTEFFEKQRMNHRVD